MKTILKIIGLIGLILVIAFAGSIGRLIGKSTALRYSAGHQQGERDAELNSLLIKTSKEVNAQLPMMVDKETRIDNMLVIDKQVYYKYTLINFTSGEITDTVLRKIQEPILIEKTCSSDNAKLLLKQGVIYNYVYHDKNDKEIGTVKITSDKCNH